MELQSPYNKKHIKFGGELNMSWMKRQRGYRDYINQKMLIILLVLSIFPVLGFGMIVYTMGLDIVRTEVNQSSDSALSQVKEQVELLVSQIEQTTGQFSIQSNVSDVSKIGASPSLGSIQAANVLRNDLLALQSSFPAMDSIYYYHATQDTMVTSQLITDLSSGYFHDTNWLPAIQKEAERNKQSFWLAPRPLPDTPTGSRLGVSYIALLPVFYSELKAALVVNVDTKYLSRMIGNSPFVEKGNILIFSETGQFIVQGGAQSGIATAEAERIYGYLAQLPEGRHSGEFKIDQETYNISFAVSNKNGWAYASLIPTEALYQKVNGLKKMVIGITGLLAVMAFVVSIFSFNRFQSGLLQIVRLLSKSSQPASSPYRSLIQNYMARIETGILNLLEEMQQARVRWEEHLPLLKDHYLFSALANRSADLDKLVHLHDHRANLFLHAHFSVFLMEIDPPKGDVPFGKEDENLFLYAVANIAGELMKPVCLAETVIIQGNVIMILNMPKPVKEKELFEAAEEIRKTVGRLLKQTITIAMGSVVGSFGDISASYYEAVNLLRQNWVKAGDEVLSFRQTNERLSQQMLDYPADIEKLILEAIRSVDAAEAVGQLERFGAYLVDRHASLHVMRTYYFQLLVTVIRLVQDYEEDLRQIFGSRSPFVEIVALEGQKSVQDWFAQSVLQTVIDYFSRMRSHRKQQLVADAIGFIQKHYRDDVSLQMVADRLQINTSYLSLIFKEASGENFIDYITRYRIDKVKELLVETDINIGQIAGEVGYNNAQQLIRVFKRVEGITPGEFRKLHVTS